MVRHILSLTPLSRVIKDYFLICESYYAAVAHRVARPDRGDRHGAARRPQRGRRALSERLAGKIDIDFETARRLFTLVCALDWRG